MFVPYFRHKNGFSYSSTSTSYTPPQVKARYHLTDGATGAGHTVGIIELGGSFYQSDYDAAMHAYGVPSQTVTVKGKPSPDIGGADVEVMLDCCVIGGIAPKARQIVYFAENTDAGFIGAVEQSLKECDVVSISWGAPEKEWSVSSRAHMDSVIKAANKPVFVASGDNGSSDGLRGLNLDYPGSCPFVITCGGTSLTATSETVWHGSGGGFSKYYAQQPWQHGKVNGSMRGSPDVCGPADPNTGWVVYANGNKIVVGGTSAVAPMWAGLWCLKKFTIQDLYTNSKHWFNDTIKGSNGAYNAGPGWDACTGLGSPLGSAF
jgi:kumamolisin